MTLTALAIAFSLLVSSPSFCLHQSNAQHEGSECNVKNSPGVCRRILDCPSVYEDLLRGQAPGKTCGYVNFDPIVCCPFQTPTKMDVTDTNRPTKQDTSTERVTSTSRGAPLSASGVGARARAKCEEFAKAVFVLEDSPILSSLHREPVNVSLCAITDKTLIVGGTKADPKEFPHMAAVGYGNPENEIKWQCGGTLISERFVVTAAHCTYNLNWGQATWVRVGDLNLVSANDFADPQDIRVIERIRHPKYKRPSEYHDIALLRLEQDAIFNAWVRPSCLPYAGYEAGDATKATATGWGQVEWAGDQSNDLLKVTISLISQRECNRSFSTMDVRLKSGIVGDWQICAGGVGKDTCQGDSGGPLVVYNRDYYCMYSLIGVTSLGKICGSISPGVYTRVSNYVSWIEDTVWPDL